MGISIVLQISCMALTNSSSLPIVPQSKSKSRVIFSSKIVFAQIFIPFTAQYCTKYNVKNQSVFKNNPKFLSLFVTRIDFHVRRSVVSEEKFEVRIVFFCGNVSAKVINVVLCARKFELLLPPFIAKHCTLSGTELSPHLIIKFIAVRFCQFDLSSYLFF